MEECNKWKHLWYTWSIWVIVNIAKENHQVMYLLYDCNITYSIIKIVLHLIFFAKILIRKSNVWKWCQLFILISFIKIERWTWNLWQIAQTLTIQKHCIILEMKANFVYLSKRVWVQKDVANNDNWAWEL